MVQSVNQKVSEAIRKQISATLSSQIDPGFAVIRYPSGFGYFLQYGQSAYWNPQTMALVDQLVTDNGDGTADIAGASFSGRFADILAASGYVVSSSDKAAQTARGKAFSTKSDDLVAQYEADFGRIRKRDIQAAGTIPPDKTQYVADYIAKHFTGAGQSFPVSLTLLESVYTAWQAMAQQIRRASALQTDALKLIQTAETNARQPNAQNGGLQTGTAEWVAAYEGLPDVTTLVQGLSSDQPQMTVGLEFDNTGQNQLNLLMKNRLLGAVPDSDLRFSLMTQSGGQKRSADNLWKTAKKIEMEIDYAGICVVPSHPAPITQDLATGWYSQSAINQIATRTGQDVTGIQLTSTRFDAGQQFGQGKAFARVKTFVISNEPVVTMWFHGVDSAQTIQELSGKPRAELSLGKLAGFGDNGSKYEVHSVGDTGEAVKIVIKPTVPVIVPPDEALRAHVIGGVLEFPA